MKKFLKQDLLLLRAAMGGDLPLDEWKAIVKYMENNR